MLLKYKNIFFDDWEEGDDGTWSKICRACLEKYEGRIGFELCDNGSGCCGVYGCDATTDFVDDDLDGGVHYIDFDINEVEIIEGKTYRVRACVERVDANGERQIERPVGDEKEEFWRVYVVNDDNTETNIADFVDGADALFFVQMKKEAEMCEVVGKYD